MKKVIAILLAVLMAFSCVTVLASAAEAAPAEQKTSIIGSILSAVGALLDAIASVISKQDESGRFQNASEAMGTSSHVLQEIAKFFNVAFGTVEETVSELASQVAA